MYCYFFLYIFFWWGGLGNIESGVLGRLNTRKISEIAINLPNKSSSDLPLRVIPRGAPVRRGRTKPYQELHAGYNQDAGRVTLPRLGRPWASVVIADGHGYDDTAQMLSREVGGGIGKNRMKR